jgi:hypothetical protein
MNVQGIAVTKEGQALRKLWPFRVLAARLIFKDSIQHNAVKLTCRVLQN